MKKILSILALTGCIVLLGGCNKDDDAGPSKTFNFKVDGDDFKTKDIYAVRTGHKLMIIAYDTELTKVDPTDPDEFKKVNSLQMLINLDNMDEDTYDIEDLSLTELNILYSKNGESYIATKGKIKFTTLTKDKVEATFECVVTNGSDEIEIENGKLNTSVVAG